MKLAVIQRCLALMGIFIFVADVAPDPPKKGDPPPSRGCSSHAHAVAFSKPVQSRM
jgi:hypothetical protein